MPPELDLQQPVLTPGNAQKGVDVCDTINIMTVNVFLLGMQPKEVLSCLHKVVSPFLHGPSTEFIFSKQGNKKQILQIYLSILAF